MTKQEVGFGSEALETVKRGFAVSASENHLLALGTNGGKGENLGLARINLKVDRQATANERTINVTDLDSTHASVFHWRHQHPDFPR
ncbi:hypothetical protein ACXHXM_06940|uniref:hypothetical protein n=1 Tax=Rhizobium altiplani TaxID=1864509 RepID=UPI001FD90B07|nr:hypothetical protein [Rhizobium altiplani]